MIKNKKILFIYDYLYTGGIETLILRMANWLVDEGYELSIVLRKKGEIAEHFDSKVNVIELGKIYRLLYLPLFSEKVLKKYNLQEFNYIMSFHPRSNWIAANLIDNLKLKAKYITGVYHPRAYFNNDLHLSEKICYKYLFSHQNSNAILFMNDETKLHHQINLNSKFIDSTIWPLPVEGKIIKQRKVIKYKFVSIGRFAKFKTYNIYMMNIIRKLLNEGFDIVYEIYGTGELEKYMKEEITKLSLEKNVFLKGNLNYSYFSKILEDVYLFIGMGTSVIEASFCKVPSLVAIENSKEDISYGFLHQLPYYNVGERNNNLKEKKVYNLIKDLLLLDDKAYEQTSEKAYDYVKAYSMENLMPKWLEQMDKLPLINTNIPQFYKYLYLVLEVINPILKVFKKKSVK